MRNCWHARPGGVARGAQKMPAGLQQGLAAAQSLGRLILCKGSGAVCQGQPGAVGREAGSWQLGQGLGGAGRGDKGKEPPGDPSPVLRIQFCQFLLQRLRLSTLASGCG